MATISLGSTITLSATFVNQVTGIQGDPATVSVVVRDASGNLVLTDVPTRQSPGVYTYSWMVSQIGNFTFEFIGTWLNSPNTITQTSIAVINAQAQYTSTDTLTNDEFINFLVNPSPFILDPEEFIATFPDASLFEIAQLIAQFSLEAQNLLKAQDSDTLATIMASDTTIAQTVLDFVQAATNCALSRIYDITNGSNSSIITLGDLSYQYQNPVSAATGRANATTWCELAGVIRDELYNMSRRSGMKAIVKGSKFCNPIPPRRIRHVEWRDWSPYAGDGDGPHEGYDSLSWQDNR